MRVILLILFSVLYSLVYSQSKRVIVFVENRINPYKVIPNSPLKSNLIYLDTLTIEDNFTVENLNIKRSGSYLVYVGDSILSSEYELPYDVFELLIHDEFMYNSHTSWEDLVDTSMVARCFEDLLEDGNWYFLIVEENGDKYFKFEKKVKGNKLSGDYIRRYKNSNISFRITFENGYMNTLYSYYESGKLRVISIYWKNGLVKYSMGYFEDGTLSSMESGSLNIKYRFHRNGKGIRTLANVYNDVSHGYTYYFNEDGCIYNAELFNYGNFVKEINTESDCEMLNDR